MIEVDIVTMLLDGPAREAELTKRALDPLNMDLLAYTHALTSTQPKKIGPETSGCQFETFIEQRGLFLNQSVNHLTNLLILLTKTKRLMHVIMNALTINNKNLLRITSL